jgi:RNA polymerase sigma-70 factor (ECF subfamily)
LVTAHYDRVHALCRRMLGNEPDALDATQDALVAAIRALHRFDGRSSFATWIYRIATNTCIDEIRRRRRRPVTGLVADIGDVADEVSFGLGAPGLFVVPPPRATDHSQSGGESRDVGGGGDGGRVGGSGPVGGLGGLGGVGGGRDPADIVAARVDIDAALGALPLDFRTAVVLRDVCDLPYDEIADILGVPVGTVRSRIARARTALAATWDADATGNHSGAPDVRRPDAVAEQSRQSPQSRPSRGEDHSR